MPRKNNIIDTRRSPIISPASRQMSLVGRLMQEVGSTAPRKMGAKPSSPIVREHRSPKAVELYSDWLTYSSYGFISFYNLIHFGRKMKNLFLFDVDPDLLFSFLCQSVVCKDPKQVPGMNFINLSFLKFASVLFKTCIVRTWYMLGLRNYSLCAPLNFGRFNKIFVDIFRKKSIVGEGDKGIRIWEIQSF